jgi:hypothetical protein
MRKSWVFGVLTLSIVLGLIGLLAFTSESVHRVPEKSARPLPAAQLTPAAPLEPEMGPMFHGSGLTLTY